jgi:hypothetical protein
MARSLLNAAAQILAGSITRALLNTSLAGSAVIAKVIAGTGISLIQTGPDAGTGDVTINAVSPTVSITFVIDGGGAAITTGVWGDLEIPFACTIVGWSLLCDQSGSIVVDVWKDVYANFPPTVAGVITASAKPTVSSATKGKSSTLTGWTTAVSAGDMLRINVNSTATVTRATLTLTVTKT